MPRASNRYYSENDLETGVTPSQLKRLDGEFTYIWGGPYSALEELEDQFGGTVSEERIQQVADEVQRAGIYDWAPGPDHPDHQRASEEYQANAEANGPLNEASLKSALAAVTGRIAAGAEAHLGDGWELGERQRILDRLSRLEAALGLSPYPAGIGHNNPPRDDDKSEKLRAHILAASATIRTELKKDRPLLQAIARGTSGLLAGARWIGKKVDVTVDAFAKSFGTTAGPLAATAVFTPAVHQMILEACNTAIQWLTNITAPF